MQLALPRSGVVEKSQVGLIILVGRKHRGTAGSSCALWSCFWHGFPTRAARSHDEACWFQRGVACSSPERYEFGMTLLDQLGSLDMGDLLLELSKGLSKISSKVFDCIWLTLRTSNFPFSRWDCTWCLGWAPRLQLLLMSRVFTQKEKWRINCQNKLKRQDKEARQRTYRRHMINLIRNKWVELIKFARALVISPPQIAADASSHAHRLPSPNPIWIRR